MRAIPRRTRIPPSPSKFRDLFNNADTDLHPISQPSLTAPPVRLFHGDQFSWRPWVKLGAVKLRGGDGAGALAAYQESLDIRRKLAAQDPGNAIAQRDVSVSLNDRCWARVIIGQQLQQALLDCSESLRIRPNDADTLGSRGFAYLKLGRLDNAIVDFNAALKINSKLANSLYGRGLAKLKKGDRPAADADEAAAKAINADIAEELARYGIK